VQVESKFKLEEVECVDFVSPGNVADIKKYKYYCPICLRYFNNMLMSLCCSNYTCLFCINDLKE